MEKVISLISSLPLTEAMLISQFKVFNARLSCSTTHTLDSLVIFWVFSPLKSVITSACLHSSRFPPLWNVAVLAVSLVCSLRSCRPPHAEVCSSSSSVNNAWPPRFWMQRKKKISGLGCFFFFSFLSFCLLASWDPHAYNIWPAAERNTEWHPPPTAVGRV